MTAGEPYVFQGDSPFDCGDEPTDHDNDPPAEPPAEDPWAPTAPEPRAPTEPPDQKTLRRIAITLADHGVTDRAVRLEIVGRAAERRVASSKDLSRREAYRVLDRINQAAHTGRLAEIIRLSTAYVQQTHHYSEV